MFSSCTLFLAILKLNNTAQSLTLVVYLKKQCKIKLFTLEKQILTINLQYLLSNALMQSHFDYVFTLLLRPNFPKNFKKEYSNLTE